MTTSSTQTPPPRKAGARPGARGPQGRRPGRAHGRQAKFPRLSTFQKSGLIIGAIAFFGVLVIDIPNLPPVGQRMFAIFLLAIVFWVTEAIPLTATAVLVIFLEVILVSQGAILPVPEDSLAAASYFAALANPVIVLFLGDFLIADGAAKFGLDKNLAAVLIRPFAGSARSTVFGLMLITAILSMFMSNTATTATMFAVVLPILKSMDSIKARAAVALSIPLAANVGGLGTPVGTPPNAIALAVLNGHGIRISFLQWMMLAVPFMLVVLLGAWLFLTRVYVPKQARIDLEIDSDFDTSKPAIAFYVVAGSTIALWMTEPLHGVSSTIVGFLPVVALLSLRVMTGEDVKRLDWPVLWLVSGGIALGTGVGATGLDTWLIGSINWSSMGPWLIMVLLGLIGYAMANVISHSASANLLVPLAVSLVASINGDIAVAAAVVALACSLGMSMPISTPPNAIAYATGQVSTKDMAITGLTVGTLATAVLVTCLPWVWTTLNLL